MTTGRAITPADWARIEESLSGLFGSETLMCDGYKLTIVRKQDRNKLVLMVYVNDYIKGEWLAGDCEERRRFMRRKTWRLFPAAKVAKLTAGMSARGRANFVAEMGLDKTLDSYTPVWTGFKALRQHLVKNNKEILVPCHKRWVVVSGAGTDDEIIVSYHDSYWSANAACMGAYSHCDVMKRLPDGTLTTEF